MASKRKPGGKRPASTDRTLSGPTEPADDNQRTPRFCLAHLVKDFDVEACEQALRADFAHALAKRSQLTWGDLARSDRHALGWELISAKSIKPAVPERFSDASKFHTFRYSGKLPMAGVRIGDTFHVLWIERRFGDLYTH